MLDKECCLGTESHSYVYLVGLETCCSDYLSAMRYEI